MKNKKSSKIGNRKITKQETLDVMRPLRVVVLRRIGNWKIGNIGNRENREIRKQEEYGILLRLRATSPPLGGPGGHLRRAQRSGTD